MLIEATDSSSSANHQLIQAMYSLDDRSQDILQRRWLNDPKSTLHELADDYGVSAERIRQLEKAAMNKLRAQIESY